MDCLGPPAEVYYNCWSVKLKRYFETRCKGAGWEDMGLMHASYSCHYQAHFEVQRDELALRAILLTQYLLPANCEWYYMYILL